MWYQLALWFQWLLQVKMSCSLLRDVLLVDTHFQLHECPKPATADVLDMQWVLRQSMSQLQLENIQSVGSVSKPSSSACTWAGELFSIIKAVVKAAYPQLWYR